jgi:hypothetical protein
LIKLELIANIFCNPHNNLYKYWLYPKKPSWAAIKATLLNFFQCMLLNINNFYLLCFFCLGSCTVLQNMNIYFQVMRQPGITMKNNTCHWESHIKIPRDIAHISSIIRLLHRGAPLQRVNILPGMKN